jgi:hypothetical protein
MLEEGAPVAGSFFATTPSPGTNSYMPTGSGTRTEMVNAS